jgi:multiple antibiotic resistance protein
MWWQQRLSEFVTLFLVINPFGALPTFMEIAETLDPRAQRKLALHASVVSFAVLVFFVFAGAFLLVRWL